MSAPQSRRGYAALTRARFIFAEDKVDDITGSQFERLNRNPSERESQRLDLRFRSCGSSSID